MYTWRIGVIAPPPPLYPTCPALPLPYQTAVSALTDAIFLADDNGVALTRVQKSRRFGGKTLGCAGRTAITGVPTAITLGCHLPKDPARRMSIWEKSPLNDDQMCTRK